MNGKITLPVLTQLLAIQTGDSKKLAEDFIKELFGIISAELVKGEQVKIKDLGVFKTITVEARKSVNVSTGEEYEIPSHRKVVFVPAKELASHVNEEFEIFGTEEILNEELLQEEAVEEPITEPTETAETVETIETIETIESIETIETTETTETNESNESFQSAEYVLDESEDESVIEPESEPGPEVESEPEPVAEVAKPSRMRFWLGFVSGFVVAAVLCGVAYVWVHQPNLDDCLNRPTAVLDDTLSAKPQVDEDSIQDVQNEEEAKEATPEVAEPKAAAQAAADEAPTQPSDAPVYDYISKTRYLTTMAKDHYGNYHLWPYIYEENKAFLGHPDRIKPGTRVVIPSLKKYGIDPTNPADIEKAKKKGQEIYSRYK